MYSIFFYSTLFISSLYICFARALSRLSSSSNISSQSLAILSVSLLFLLAYRKRYHPFAVNAANAYNVSLDYLFGTGYKEPKNNEYSMYNMGFSEETLDFLCVEEHRLYVDAILSDPRMQKISDILYASGYKPLINSYEMNYISKLVADLLYCILVDVTKNAYKLRPMFEEEIDELLDAVNDCIKHLEEKGFLLISDYDKYEDCEDTIQTELERIKSLLENAPITNYNQAREDGFSAAIRFLASNEFQLVSPDEPWIKEDEMLQEYIRKIPLKKQINMSTEELFLEAKKNDGN